MSKVRVHITVSADGYVAGPNPSLEDSLGEGGGARLFDGLGPDLELEQVRVNEAPAVTHLNRVIT